MRKRPPTVLPMKASALTSVFGASAVEGDSSSFDPHLLQNLGEPSISWLQTGQSIDSIVAQVSAAEHWTVDATILI